MADSVAIKGKYQPLFLHLSALDLDEWPASFSEIEAVLGFALPRSARAHQPWWSNQSNPGSHTHAQSWQRAGWRAGNVDLANETVVFRRERPMAQSNPISGPRRKETSTADYEEDVPPGNATGQEGNQPRNGSAHALFEQLARWVMADHHGVGLAPGKCVGVNKFFDMAAADRTVVGDAKYFSMVHGERLPPAKFSIIAEHVWLLEKTGAKAKFLVFGNDRRVPEKWLERYGDLASDVAFYFLGDDGRLETLRPAAE